MWRGGERRKEKHNTPWPRGPVVTSTPGARPRSGCPAVLRGGNKESFALFLLQEPIKTKESKNARGKGETQGSQCSFSSRMCLFQFGRDRQCVLWGAFFPTQKEKNKQGEWGFSRKRGDRHGADVADLLELLQGDIISGEVQHGIEQRTAVPVGQDEAVAAQLEGTERRRTR